MATYIIILILLVVYVPQLRDWVYGRIYAIRLAIARWKLEREIKQAQQKQISQAEALIREAKLAIDRDTYNPFEIELLNTAINYYQQSYKIVNNSS